MTRTALIVGAGIAGMTAAGELARAGIEVDLIEREPEPVFRGIGILLLPPAVRSMEMLGLAEACLERGFPQVDSATFLADGTLLARTPMVGLAEGDLPPAIGIARSAFGDVLRERAEAGGVRLRCALTIDALEESGDVRFSDGSTGRYDVVVGADGLRSSVRAAVFPEQPEPMFIGQSVWRVLVGTRPDEVHGQMLFLGAQTRAGFNAIREDDMYLYCVHATAEDDVPLDRAESHARLMELLERVRRARGRGPRPLHARPAAALRPALHDLRRGPVASWQRRPHRRRRARDAAAPGQRRRHRDRGRDRARAVPARRGTVPHAFEAFMDRRYERCRMVIENSRTLARWDLDPDASGGEAAALMTDTWAALAQPI